MSDTYKAGSPAEVSDLLRHQPGRSFGDIDGAATPGFEGKKADGLIALETDRPVLKELQEKLHASAQVGQRRALLLVLQGRDSSGKGGITKHIVGSFSPHGVDVSAFGVPTKMEAAHHFLWRIYRELPAYGQIGVFDRSHYEDILATRMHRLAPEAVWKRRYDEINEFEEGLANEGTVVVKVMLGVSPEKQEERLLDRLERPEKHWKYNPSDLEDRRRWHEYSEAFQDVLDRTSTFHAPWFVVPADRKWYARWAVGRLLIRELERLDLQWPGPAFDVDEQRKILDATTKAIAKRA